MGGTTPKQWSLDPVTKEADYCIMHLSRVSVSIRLRENVTLNKSTGKNWYTTPILSAIQYGFKMPRMLQSFQQVFTTMPYLHKRLNELHVLYAKTVKL